MTTRGRVFCCCHFQIQFCNKQPATSECRGAVKRKNMTSKRNLNEAWQKVLPLVHFYYVYIFHETYQNNIKLCRSKNFYTILIWQERVNKKKLFPIFLSRSSILEQQDSQLAHFDCIDMGKQGERFPDWNLFICNIIWNFPQSNNKTELVWVIAGIPKVDRCQNVYGPRNLMNV